MSHPSSETYFSKLVTPEYNNCFSSPYVPKNIKSQFKLEMKDSKNEDLLIDSTQGDTGDHCRRSSQEIFEDFESKFRGPSQADKKSEKKVIPVSVVMDFTKEPNWPKTQACKRRPLDQPISGVDKFLEARNEVSAVGNGIF
uniref:Uncharacterized protein n=1 Tax=Cannabis sativa TaxID=3483 RepID=A0A803PA35_CANSA